MAEKELLNELSQTLDNDSHKKYVEVYVSEKTKGLSEKFDELFRKELSET